MLIPVTRTIALDDSELHEDVLRASGAGIGLAESIYLGEEGRVRRTEQIVLVGQVPAEGTGVRWALTRMEG